MTLSVENLPPLTQRQERRIVRHPPTVTTTDSWDFATTVHSQTSTIHHRRRPLEDLAVHEAGTEKQEEIFDFESSDDWREEEERLGSTTSSSSQDDVSTDALRRGTSTPPTTPPSFVESPPSPKLLAQESAVPSSSPQSEETGGKKLWSRIVSNVRKPSSLKSTAPSQDMGRSPPRPDSKQMVPESSEGRAGSQPKTLTGQAQVIRNSTGAKTTDTASRVSENSSGVSVTDGIPLGSWGRKGSKDLVKTSNAKRRGSRGSILGGVIGEARNKLSLS